MEVIFATWTLRVAMLSDRLSVNAKRDSRVMGSRAQVNNNMT